MKIGEFFRNTLKMHGNSPHLSEIVLRAIIVNIERLDDMSSFFLMLHKEINNKEKINECIKRVLQGEPYQYVLNEASFYGMNIYINEDVLIPRMETEELVKMVLDDYPNPNGELVIADIGTGSGCIALSLKKHLPKSKIFASDISKKAIVVASTNIIRHSADITLFEGDLLEPFIASDIKFDIIISNPPYIKEITDVEEKVLIHEPHLALFAKDGIDFYIRIFKDAHKVLNNNGAMYFEINYDQKDSLTNEIMQYLPNSKYEFFKDAFGLWRKLKIIYHE